jgi:hypothetical protein
MSYAEGTSVSVEKTRAEIERLITKFGANRFMTATEPGRAFIGFELKGKMVRFTLPLPDQKEPRFWRTPTKRLQRTTEEAYREWEQACRSAWRALGLCIKAKLEAVGQGITTFETEFLAHFVLPNGQTMGEHSIPLIEQMAKDGQMPRLMIGPPQSQGNIISIEEVK